MRLLIAGLLVRVQSEEHKPHVGRLSGIHFQDRLPGCPPTPRSRSARGCDRGSRRTTRPNRAHVLIVDSRTDGAHAGGAGTDARSSRAGHSAYGRCAARPGVRRRRRVLSPVDVDAGLVAEAAAPWFATVQVRTVARERTHHGCRRLPRRAAIPDRARRCRGRVRAQGAGGSRLGCLAVSQTGSSDSTTAASCPTVRHSCIDTTSA